MRLASYRRLNDERGATLPVVAVCLTMLIGVAAIAIDLGMLFNSRSEAQRVADAAALAGASVFSDEAVSGAQLQAAVYERVHLYGELNTVMGQSVRPDEMGIVIEEANGLVRVTVTREDIPLWFARIFGRDTGRVVARAAAAVRTSGTVECMRPIAFADLWHERRGSPVRFSGRNPSQPPCAWGDTDCDYYNPTETGRGHWWRNPGMPGPDGKGQYLAPDAEDDVGRLLRFDLNDNTGNFGAESTERLFSNRYYPLRPPAGANCANGGACWRRGLAGEICTGRISIGDVVSTEPGVQVGPTDQGFQAALDADPGARWDAINNRVTGSRYPLGCSAGSCTGEGSPRIFNVAMVHPESRIVSNASDDFVIQNFSAFFLERWRASGNQSWVEVRWMKPKAVADNCVARGNCRASLPLPLRLVE